MKKTLPEILKFVVLLAGTVAFCATGRAQNTAYWTNTAGGEWNTAANWNVNLTDVNLVPTEGTNVDIGSVGIATVDYNTPMAAANVGVLTLAAANALNVNASGLNFNGGGVGTALIGLSGTININAGGILTASNGGPVTVNAGGILNVGGGMAIEPIAGLAPLVISAGGLVNATTGGSLTGTGAVVTATGAGLRINVSGGSVDLGTSGLSFLTAGGGLVSAGSLTVGPLRLGGAGAGNTGFLTNSGGNISATSTIVNPNNVNINCLMVINGGVNDLGPTTVNRSSSGSATFNALGSEGLIISNGVVRVNGLNVGFPAGNSALTIQVAGGILTNTADMIVNNQTSGRGSRFLQHGGLVVTTDPNLVRVSITNAGQVNIFSVLGGTNMAGGFVLGSLTNVSGTINFTNAAKIYIGSGGIVSNAILNLNIALNNGGVFGANADWTGAVPIILNGGSFDAADLGGTAHNITISGPLRGSAALNKIGAGNLVLTSTNLYTGNTVINQGRLVLGATATISNTPQINIAGGAVLDVSAAGYSLRAGQSLVGSGAIAGNLSAQTSSTISPGTSAGTLTFSNNLTQAGGVLNLFELSAGSSDLLVVEGTLDVSAGVNSISVGALGGSIPAGTYPLFQYGALVGGVGNFTVTGAPGFLTNDVTAKTISLVTTGVRPPASIVWVGSPNANDFWDILTTTNWLNGGTTDFFVQGDTVRFDDVGGLSPVVSVVGLVTSGGTTVDSATNYTFTGNGQIGGSGGLTKTNSGTLTVLTTNLFTGPTIVGGGWLEATTIRNNGTASSIGAAPADPANLVFHGGSLRYLGVTTSSDRGATLNSDATVEVTNSAAGLTLGGSVIGAGALTKTGPGTFVLSGPNTYQGATTVSNGVLQINSVVAALGTNAVNLAGGTLFLNVGGQPTYNLIMNLLSASTINVAANNTIFLAAFWTGTDTLNINVTGAGLFTVNSDISPNFTGTLALGASTGLLRFNSGGNSTSAQQCAGSSNVVFDLGSGSAALVNRNGGGLTFGNYFLGALAGGANTQLRGSENSGSASIYHIGDRNLSTTFAGSIRTGNNGAAATTSIVKVGSGSLTLSGTNTYTGSTTINNGVLALSGFGAIGNSASILVPTNSVLDVSGRVDGTLTLNASQNLRGSGTVRGSVTANNGASITVGDMDNFSDQMVISNALVLNSGSTLNLDLDHYQFFGAQTNDSIQGLSSVTYGGTLNLNVLSVETNSVFKLFSAGSYQGAFASINPPSPPLAQKWTWDTSYLAVDGTLRITVLRPTMNSITASGVDLTISGSNGISGADYYVLSSTNVALPLSQWTPIVTNNFVSSDFQFTLTNALSSGEPQQFYLLQVIVP